MFHAMYYEEEVSDHPLVQDLCSRYRKIPKIPCGRYTEIFNRKAQNFRLQKQAPALILARKFNNWVLKTPDSFGIGGKHNYYFSHMLNCIFDCRYCFLQGMYRSGNYVVFVNFEDFQEAIREKINSHKGEEVYFFSGYDCDSLALENVTHFIEKFLPFFKNYPNAYLELRTKSTNIRFLIDFPPIKNCIVAYTLTPSEIAKAVEHRTPSVESRIDALVKLQEKGWPVGLRFDPVIYCDDYQEHYSQLYAEVFEKVSLEGLHSVTLGPLRFPRDIYKNITKLYPDEKLLSHSIEERDGIVSYKKDLEKQMLGFCQEQLLNYIPEELFFPM